VNIQSVDPEVRDLLDLLPTRIQAVLGPKLVGAYLYGSLTTGAFDLAVSDIDLVAAVQSVPDEEEAQRLEAMHAEIEAQHPRWQSRIEVSYFPLAFLAGAMGSFQMANISPGEPFHVFTAEAEKWVVNRHALYSQGIRLYGAPLRELVQPVSPAELLECVREHCRHWPEWVLDMRTRGSQAYSILTLCRALYTVRNGESVSKLQAAAWAQQALPEWKPVIERALVWRRNQWIDFIEDLEAFPQTQAFVNHVVHLIL
jgi:hypothetical protein